MVINEQPPRARRLARTATVRPAAAPRDSREEERAEVGDEQEVS